MTKDDVRWELYPTVAQTAAARAWLGLQADRNLAVHTIETYGRSLEDFLRFMGQQAIEPTGATRAQVAGYLRDLTSRANPKQPNVVLLESRAGLSNSTILLRLSVIRLFYDHLMEDGVRVSNPVGRSYGRKQYGRRATETPLFRRSRRLPWIPTEEQWRALLGIVMRESIRNRLMFALSYDAALRRQELLGLDTGDLDPAHRLARVRAENAKNGCERVVPYSPATSQLLARYLDERRGLSRSRGRLFRSASRRNVGEALSIWAWSKIVKDVARVSGVARFTTHTLRHLCLTDLARAGWDIHEIAAFAGHRSLASTLLYIHLSGRELASKVAATMTHLHTWRVQQLAEVRA